MLSQRALPDDVTMLCRANGSIRFEFNDAVDEGLSFGIPILQVCCPGTS